METTAGRDLVVLEQTYEIIRDAPAPMSWEKYAKESYEEYQSLLQNYGDDESVFQRFFEQNPSFVPGAFELSAPSGHYPFTQSLIAEPELCGGLFDRIPDFIWLAQDSLSFTPVLIEIEKPNKKTFTKAGTQTADLTQAFGQIVEWQAILNNPVNLLQFYECFKIPDWVRQKNFAPQYGLIYGRRSEFESNTLLSNKRAHLAPEGVSLISFDRLYPEPKCSDLLCTTLSHGTYTVKTVPPTYRYSPGTADNLTLVSGFATAILRMTKISPERKEFLLSRYSYWESYGKRERKGCYSLSDYE